MMICESGSSLSIVSMSSRICCAVAVACPFIFPALLSGKYAPHPNVVLSFSVVLIQSMFGLVPPSFSSLLVQLARFGCTQTNSPLLPLLAGLLYVLLNSPCGGSPCLRNATVVIRNPILCVIMRSRAVSSLLYIDLAFQAAQVKYRHADAVFTLFLNIPSLSTLGPLLNLISTRL